MWWYLKIRGLTEDLFFEAQSRERPVISGPTGTTVATVLESLAPGAEEDDERRILRLFRRCHPSVDA